MKARSKIRLSDRNGVGAASAITAAWGERGGITSIASPASSTTTPLAGTSTLSPAMARALLMLVTAASVAAGLLATGTEASASAIALAGADLTHLLRAMALLKVAMAAGMAAAVLWRLGSPVTPVWWRPMRWPSLAWQRDQA
jgi:hypothetical protein